MYMVLQKQITGLFGNIAKLLPKPSPLETSSERNKNGSNQLGILILSLTHVKIMIRKSADTSKMGDEPLFPRAHP